MMERKKRGSQTAHHDSTTYLSNQSHLVPVGVFPYPRHSHQGLHLHLLWSGIICDKCAFALITQPGMISNTL